MRKRLLFLLLALCTAMVFTWGQAMARQRLLQQPVAPAAPVAAPAAAVEGGDDSGYADQDQKDDDAVLDGEDLARICFVKKEGGKEMVFIRIPPGMYRMAKLRASAKMGHGIVRVKMRPRHILAIEQTLGKRPNHPILRLSARRMQDVRGLKGHYTVREKDRFMRELDSDEPDKGDDD